MKSQEMTIMTKQHTETFAREILKEINLALKEDDIEHAAFLLSVARQAIERIELMSMEKPEVTT